MNSINVRYADRMGYLTPISILALVFSLGGTLYATMFFDSKKADAENRPATSRLHSSNNPDFASLLRRLDKDGNGVTTIEEIVEGFGEIADRKGVYHHEYGFTLPDGTRQSLLIDLDYRER